MTFRIRIILFHLINPPCTLITQQIIWGFARLSLQIRSLATADSLADERSLARWRLQSCLLTTILLIDDC